MAGRLAPPLPPTFLRLVKSEKPDLNALHSAHEA
jgi:hypothetical protein